jgi:hypothetical protein
METDTQVQPPVFMELAAELWDAPAPPGVGVGHTDIVRSEENILRWMAYLPQDCIEAMIRMGWDVTT